MGNLAVNGLGEGQNPTRDIEATNAFIEPNRSGDRNWRNFLKLQKEIAGLQGQTGEIVSVVPAEVLERYIMPGSLAERLLSKDRGKAWQRALAEAEAFIRQLDATWVKLESTEKNFKDRAGKIEKLLTQLPASQAAQFQSMKTEQRSIQNAIARHRKDLESGDIDSKSGLQNIDRKLDNLAERSETLWNAFKNKFFRFYNTTRNVASTTATTTASAAYLTAIGIRKSFNLVAQAAPLAFLKNIGGNIRNGISELFEHVSNTLRTGNQPPAANAYGASP